MEFLIEYGLFLAKTVTFVVALAVVIGLVVSAGMKGPDDGDGDITVKKVNERFNDMRDTIRYAVIDEKKLKKEEKDKKKADKKLKKEVNEEDKKRVFVLDFDGDIKASDTEQLRKTISAVLHVASTKDEIVVRLESQGGMVHSYGLASSQLARITQKNIPLTVCVDKVAASGGYMMACVANKIISAPFAIIGSIGVVAQLPNFHKILKKNDVDYEMLTAGKYKRTLTMLGENTDEGRKKFVEDLEDTHELFKDFIKSHREQVDVEKVATGEIWFGTRALEQNLIDEISTSDEYLQSLHPDNDIFEITVEQKKTLAEKLGINLVAGLEKSLLKSAEKLNFRFFAR